jgi:predicted transporter
LVVGGAAGLIGLAFVLTSIHHWLVNPERNMTLVPIGLVSILLGGGLLVITTVIYVFGRNRIRATDALLPSTPGQG